MLFTINNILFKKMKVPPLPADDDVIMSIINTYATSSKRLFLLDYDGTLVSFNSNPEAALPDSHLLDIIRILSSDERNRVAIISGRTKDFLASCFSDIRTVLIAEHGAYIRYTGSEWVFPEDRTFTSKLIVIKILSLISECVPGSFIEEKDFSVVWHYRNADASLARDAVNKIKAQIYTEIDLDEIDIYDGDMIIDIRVPGINKGIAATYLRIFDNYDFTLAAGDDSTDEDLFNVLPEDAYSIKIGNGITSARYYMNNVSDLRALLSRITDNT